jgi:hypothetical protein
VVNARHFCEVSGRNKPRYRFAAARDDHFLATFDFGQQGGKMRLA